jgi:D-alanine-D-alanine ligase-like ATP-grasp enzyme/GNAT superfamily N-acetyltransferase
VELTAVSRVLILYNQIEEGDDPSTKDILSDVRWVSSGLVALGIPYRVLAVPGWKPWLHVAADPETVIFNLFEAPPGVPGALTSATAALEAMNLPFTGSSAAALWLTTDKLATRAVLTAEGLPVAPGGRLDPDRPELLDRIPGPWILKPACEDASLGLEGEPVCATRDAALARARHLQVRFPDEPILAERYLPGRELNVSLLAREDGGVEVLPVAEILFEGYPEGMPRVVTYEAKWLEGSFAYAHTPRHFPEDPADGALLARVREIAAAAWRICGLRGYARVDLRLDEHGEPHILEVNANPCLAEDAGFPAAAAKAGLSRREAVGRIVAAAVRGRPQAVSLASASLKHGNGNGLHLRRDLAGSDRPAIEALIRATAFFNPEEVGVALELVDDRLARGEASHYQFLVAEVAERVVGYACWGPVPGTIAAADLYWIVVHPERQGNGVGAALLQTAEEWIAKAGRTRVYVETSTRPQYHPTRAFYAACGYEQAAELADFYGPGDGKAVLLKVLGAEGARHV